MSMRHSVCVFCGSRNGARPSYVEAARATGAMLAQEGWRLVYGAGDVGLMGEVARAAQGAGAGGERRHGRPRVAAISHRRGVLEEIGPPS